MTKSKLEHMRSFPACISLTSWKIYTFSHNSLLPAIWTPYPTPYPLLPNPYNLPPLPAVRPAEIIVLIPKTP